MKIELDSSLSHPFHINSYDKGSVLIGEQRFTASLIVTPSIVINDWAPQTFTDIASRHLEQVFEMEPELILLGTGREQHFPAADFFRATTKFNIGIEVMDTGAACRSYNILLQEGRNVAAALLMIE